MTARIVALSNADRARVAGLFARAADYVRLETGSDPDAATAADFLVGAPPGCDPGLKLGQETEGRLLSIADLAFGFPEAADAFIGLLLVDPAWRGRGLGAAMVAHLADEARRRGATRILAAVLEANPAGRRFWEREGFRVVLVTEPRLRGERLHVIHRMARTLAPDAPPAAVPQAEGGAPPRRTGDVRRTPAAR